MIGLAVDPRCARTISFDSDQLFIPSKATSRKGVGCSGDTWGPPTFDGILHVVRC
jgi:hypothetical protein